MAKQDDYVRYTIRVPAALYARLQSAAGESSVNAEIVSQLEEVGSLRERNELLMKIVSEYQLREAHLQDQLSTYSMNLPELPATLMQRITHTARARGRSTAEEIAQALEAAFPPPPSLKELISWMGTFSGAQPVPGYEDEFYGNLHKLRLAVADYENAVANYKNHAGLPPAMPPGELPAPDTDPADRSDT